MFEPGEYTVSATGYGGVLPMIVTFSEDRIEDIVIDPSNETGGYVGPVIRDLIPDILEDQSTEVDLVTGATITSQAVINGVLEAIELAGGDPNQFQ